MVNINHLGTEQRNEKTKDLDLLSTMEIIRIMNEEDLNVVAGVKQALPQIEKVVHAMIEALSNGGRIVYVGAGTSGRTGIIDAVECGPTFSCTYEFLGLIAGGYGAIVKAVEGAEDKKELCVEDLKNNDFCSKDLLVGVAASGRTPYVIGAMRYAKECGAHVIGVTCSPGSPIENEAEIAIVPVPGPEVVTGSTRMKSGTAQKLVLNMLSTGTMIKMGKVYGNLMVDVKPSNEKLVHRCERIVSEATGVSEKEAAAVLEKCNYRPKIAIVMILCNIDADVAIELLHKNDEKVSAAIGEK